MRPSTSGAWKATAATAKLLNPTSTRRTVLQYVIMILLAANHILNNHPRHEEFRRHLHGQSQSDSSGRSYHIKKEPTLSTTPNKQHDRTHEEHIPAKSSRRERRYENPPNVAPQIPTPAVSSSRPPPPLYGAYHSGHKNPNNLAYCAHHATGHNSNPYPPPPAPSPPPRTYYRFGTTHDCTSYNSYNHRPNTAAGRRPRPRSPSPMPSSSTPTTTSHHQPHQQAHHHHPYPSANSNSARYQNYYKADNNFTTATQRRDAWHRMRAVTVIPIPVEYVRMRKDRMARQRQRERQMRPVEKKVRWGTVEIFKYEVDDDERDERDSSGSVGGEHQNRRRGGGGSGHGHYKDDWNEGFDGYGGSRRNSI